MKKFAITDVESYELNKLQDAAAAKFQDLDIQPFLNGNLIKNVSLTTGVDNFISHKLNRNWELWSLAGQSANSVVWEGTQETRNKLLNLRCSANCTVSLWVA